MAVFDRPVFEEKDEETGESRWRDSEDTCFYSIEVGADAESVMASAAINLPIIRLEPL
mgnify:CR=1 FL=1